MILTKQFQLLEFRVAPLNSSRGFLVPAHLVLKFVSNHQMPVLQNESIVGHQRLSDIPINQLKGDNLILIQHSNVKFFDETERFF